MQEPQDPYHWSRFLAGNHSSEYSGYAKRSKYHSTVLYKKTSGKRYYTKFTKKTDPSLPACPRVSVVAYC